MIINQIDAQFQYEGVTYTIGGKVRANDASDYAGLYGTITEIRDGDDRETENSTPDIYCSFMGSNFFNIYGGTQMFTVILGYRFRKITCT